MQRKLLVIVLLPAFCFLLISTGLYLGRDNLTRLSNLYLPLQPQETTLTSSPSSWTTIATTSTTPEQTVAEVATSTIPALSTSDAASSPTASSSLSIANGTILSADRISPYVSAILDPTSTQLPRLECPALEASRYDVLRKELHGRQRDTNQHVDYFFALNLRDCKKLLPRLLGSIVEVALFLGPHRCALSIVEGNSPDGTGDVLNALGPFLEDVGLAYFYNGSKIDSTKGRGARIRKLAQLRNLALALLYKKGVQVTEETTVLFINDVAACPEDLLELVLQRRNLGADMTCAMDWTYVGVDPTFYDVWVARTIQGTPFFEVGEDGNWNSAWNLFWNAPETRARYNAQLPFQVFACWNGATAFTAAPLLHGLRFRDVRGDKGECFQGEPQLFCKDLWWRGYRKIAVVPAVNLEYSNEKGADIKRQKGFVSEIVQKQDEDSTWINWIYDAPDQVKCMPDWGHQSWRPWNETLR
ncbi:cryptococcal mannosyltransferase 1-domain-containing protein [Dactylonectria macrodidyma]|uniref:Cryptococcal mannosyltransferase 1-domain-containing protein n=1 Tax=Dactylonectria macrodidyma TaxID=307937 RepID=A0A9P9D3W3_9HYPO|nr:cryptococcal mannosyltransferase 1-domain-containing protein [Dactylonectria macrodidyma]